MKKILGLVACLALVSTAFAVDPTVTYTLQLGGDNHAADLKAGNPVPYTPGSTADGQLVASPAKVSWAVEAKVEGTFNTYDVFGAANLVWDLELRDSSNNLVAIGKGSASTQGWYSDVNDGTGTDPLQAAAFAYGLDANAGVAGPGRVFDTPEANGPHMAQKTYPSTEAFPAGAPIDGSLLGKLIGMGAGYQDYKVESTERGGVGIVGTFDGGACTGLGTGPIAEGQINMTGLPSGTYTLKLLAGNGNNFLRGDKAACTGNNNENFAVKVAANMVVSDDISFVWDAGVQPCTDPVLTAAVSRKTHGAAGDFDQPINLSGTVSTEPRAGGPSTIVLTYDQTLDAGTLPTVSMGTAAVSGNQVTITGLGAITDGACVAITVSGAKAATGACFSPAVTIKIRSLLADVNASGGVDAADIGQVKLQSLKPLTAANFLRDVNVSGGIDAADIGQTKLRSLKVTPDACSY